MSNANILQENITTPSVQFRMAVSYPRQFIAGDTGATLRTWGLNDGDGCQQFIGSVPISSHPAAQAASPSQSDPTPNSSPDPSCTSEQDTQSTSQSPTSIAYPNIYQTQLTPFRLLDPSQDGRLTVVSFFLVDPDIKPLVSTSNVPPQQSTWVRDALYDALAERLPGELIEAVWNEVLLGSSGGQVDVDGGQGGGGGEREAGAERPEKSWVMSQEEAEGYRTEYVDVLERFTQASNNYHFCIPFDVWNSPEMVL